MIAMSSEHDADTEDYFNCSLDQAGNPLVSTSLVKVEFAALTDRGKVRATNDDHYLVGRANRVLEPLLTNMPGETAPVRFGETAYGMLVADGIGGTEAGREVSMMAISCFVHLVLATPDWIMRPDDRQTQRVMRRMAERFRKVHLTVIEQSLKTPALSGIGTTLTLACSVGREMVIAHVGNSRVYLFRQGKLHQLTRDHTLAQKLVDIGAIKCEEVASHQSQYFLTDTIGSTGRGRADVQLIKLMDGDIVLLCTDGLNQMVEDPAIEGILTLIKSPSQICHLLMDLALARGGNDNVTVVLAHYNIPDAI
jgi:serine/threonine protein phosphatase PrpC